MNILTLENIQKTHGNKVIFKGVTAGIEDHDRIGVIGVNGTGKSTILSIVAGMTETDAGEVVMRNNLRISYLTQNPVFDPEKTILENVTTAVDGKEEHWNTEGEARAMLLRLGIEDPDGSWQFLSGGQKKRAALAAALLTPCDLLILDEPTNHLDHEMIEWLQNWLESFRGALLMVTHDRYFLDEVTTTIWEIDKAAIFRYEGNYEKYLQKKQERMDFALAAERKMAALYKQDLAWMMRGARARSTKQKAHIQRFEALRDREKIVEERNVQLASLPSRMGNKTIELDEVSKGYDGKVLFHDFTYHFLKTDRIGIIGPNGCGKSTLIKAILGEVQPDMGSISIGQTVVFGYFGQENEALAEAVKGNSHLQPNATVPGGADIGSLRVIDYVKERAEYIRTPDGLVSASSMCERFLFDKDQQYTPIRKLSGGEKRRLYLLRVLMEAPNVLILDEPTNDLDIPTLQILEDYLDHFSGIVIVVSHDRYFLDRVVNRIFCFMPDGTLRQSEGGYEEYLLHRQEWDALQTKENSFGKKPTEKSQTGQKSAKQRQTGQIREGEKASLAGSDIADTGSAGRNGRPERKKNRLSYKEQKEYDTLEALIDELTEQSALLEKQMEEAATSYFRLQELSKQKEETDALLDEKIDRFLELQELVESFQKG